MRSQPSRRWEGQRRHRERALAPLHSKPLPVRQVVLLFFPALLLRPLISRRLLSFPILSSSGLRFLLLLLLAPLHGKRRRENYKESNASAHLSAAAVCSIGQVSDHAAVGVSSAHFWQRREEVVNLAGDAFPLRVF